MKAAFFIFTQINYDLQTNPVKLLYFPLLDTTRFIAFIPVFLTHCFITSNTTIENASWFKQITHFLDVGLLGLDYFFVLSSFLITRLIIEERAKFKTFSFKLFFIRRSLRIWPLYFLMVAIGFGSYYAGLLNTKLPPLFSFISFTLNLYIAEHGYNFLFFLVFLWSISVEEQFYILWGLILHITSKVNATFFKYSILITACLLIVISLWYRYTHRQNELQLYFHTLSVTANFGIGILLAYFSAYYSWFVLLIQRMSKWSIFLLLIILMLSVFTYTLLFTYHVAILFERIYFSVLFAFIIAVLCYSSYIPMLQKFFNPFDYLGKIALGLYFYHGIVITIFSKLMIQYPIAEQSWQVICLNPLIMLTLSILCASLSYNYFEKPILALKNRFYRHLKSAA